MNKAFEKILDRLEEERELSYADFNRYVEEVSPCLDDEYDDFFHRGLERASRLVKEVAEEYKGGWIPCSERLPEIDGNTSDTVLVCGSNGFLYMAFWCDDLQWRFCECGMAKEPVLWTEIVAWQPLPEQFKERD